MPSLKKCLPQLIYYILIQKSEKQNDKYNLVVVISIFILPHNVRCETKGIRKARVFCKNIFRNIERLWTTYFLPNIE